jgi:hypothetical protein
MVKAAAVMEATMMPAVEAAAVPPARVGGSREREGEHHHERQTEDLLHDQPLLDGLRGCVVNPLWRLGRGNALLASLIVTLQPAPRISVRATLKTVEAEMYRFPMGWNWYVLNFYVPMIVVSHVMIVRYLLLGRGVQRS